MRPSTQPTNRPALRPKKILARAAALCATAACAFGADAQSPPAPPAGTAPQEVPWPIVLGMRAAALERAWPVVDEVVLVPDGRTYLDEIARWTPATRWPVLLEDDVFAPMFVRAFKPARVVRRASVGTMPADRAEREQLIDAAAIDGFGEGAPDFMTACRARGVAPSMVVIADAMDPAWTAALALSAGRGAPIRFTSESYGAPNATLDDAGFRRLAREVERAAASTGLPWKGLGDAIDAFVVCRDVAWKATPVLGDDMRLEIPSGPFPTKPGQPIATLNALGRHLFAPGDDGIWWAMGAGIFGSEARSAYVAMSSLFLPRESAWLFNGYDQNGGWKAYDTAAAATALERAGFATRNSSGDQMTLPSWRRVLMGGFDADAIVLNTHGVANRFGLQRGGTANVGDVPVLDRPAMVHCLHSFSLQNPASPDTVGGAFIAHGAYLYHGSVYEPLLSAFVTPEMLAERAGYLIPFAVSARVLEGPFARPWRVATYGDPLALLATPGRIGVRRVAPAEAPREGAVPLTEIAAAGLASFRDAKEAGGLVDAMRALALLGDDAKLRSVWAVARGTEAAGEAARLAMPAAFRARELDEVAAMVAMVDEPTALELDMLWQLAMPRLGQIDDAPIVALLAANPRGRDASMDLGTLKDAAVRVLGRDAWRQAVDRAQAAARDDGSRSRIEALR